MLPANMIAKRGMEWWRGGDAPAAAAPAASGFGVLTPPGAAAKSSIEAEISKMKTSFARTKAGVVTQIQSCKSVAEYARKVAEGYANNMQSLTDVTRLLHMYMTLFGTLRAEMEAMDAALGTDSIKARDLDALHALTTERLSKIAGELRNDMQPMRATFDAMNQSQMFKKVEANANTVTGITAEAQKLRAQADQLKTLQNGGSKAARGARPARHAADRGRGRAAAAAGRGRR
jgi:hypothetical protein